MIKKIFKIALNTIFGFLIFTGALVVFSFVKIPGNYNVFTVQSGSMEPAIHTGSLIFVKPMSDYKIDDIITKRTKDPKVTITHRIVSKDQIDGKIAFTTKGDANDSEDTEKVAEEEIIGKSFLAVPFLGYPVSYAKTTQGLILLIIIPAIIIIYDEARKIEKEIAKKIDYWKRTKKRKETIQNKSDDNNEDDNKQGDEKEEKI